MRREGDHICSIFSNHGNLPNTIKKLGLNRPWIKG
jgi:hypothetical protein